MPMSATLLDVCHSIPASQLLGRERAHVAQRVDIRQHADTARSTLSASSVHPSSARACACAVCRVSPAAACVLCAAVILQRVYG